MTTELGMGLMFLIVIGAAILWLVDQARLKSCPYCCKRIAVQALKCPYCQSSLNGSADSQDVAVRLGDQENPEPVQRPTTLHNREWVAAMKAGLEAERAARDAAEAKRMAAQARLRDEREADRGARRLRRDAAYRAKGIEPGPMAWFKAMPDSGQALLIGIGLALPLASVAAMVLRAMAPLPAVEPPAVAAVPAERTTDHVAASHVPARKVVEPKPPEDQPQSPLNALRVVKMIRNTMPPEALDDNRSPEPKTKDEMIEVIKLYVTLTLGELAERMPADDVEIKSIDIVPLPSDDRKIPWLWNVTALAEFQGKAKDIGDPPTRLATTRRSLLRLSPDEVAPTECWSELANPKTGRRVMRRHFDLSEWSPEFRAKVSGDWSEKVKEYNRSVGTDPSRDDAQKREALSVFRRDLAADLNITAEEVGEILESADKGAAPGVADMDSDAPAPAPRSALGGSRQKERPAPAAPAGGVPPRSQVTMKDRVYADYLLEIGMTRQAARRMSPTQAVRFTRARKSEITRMIAEKYGIPPGEVRAIIGP